jgi:LPS-assembly protein
MRKTLLLLRFAIFALSLCQGVVCYAATNTDLVNTAESRQDSKISELDKILNPKEPYPSCNMQDYYWSQQSGPDSVGSVSVDESKGMIISADHMVGIESRVHYSQGHVQAYKEDKSIISDWLKYDQAEARATAGGNVVLSRQFDVIKGQWMDYYVDLNRGVMKEGTASTFSTGMYASGKQVNIIDLNHIQVQNGNVTSCDPNHPAWEIRAKQINFDYQDSQGTARNATFYAESYPVLSVPFMQFPLGERRSGFLTPEIGYTNGANSNVGFMLGVPYYSNLAPNFDNQIEPKIYSGAGFMVTDDFRYLTESGSGDIYTEQMPNSYSSNYSGYRYYWHLLDNHTVMQDVTVGYNYNRVSDNNYFNDFGNFVSAVDNINLEQSLYAKYKPSWGLFDIKLLNYQTLQPVGTIAASPIYQELPQVDFNINPVQIGDTPFKINLISQYTSFGIANSALQTGQRAVLYPSITMPLTNAWGFVTPKFGYNDTYYQLNPFASAQNTQSTVNRGLPISSIDSGMVFERPLSLGSSSYVQTLEPRLYYLYIPAVVQNNIPTFDTATASYNINQLFSENRFSGFDRINAANDLTMGVNSKLINDNTGVEVANWGIAYRQYLSGYNNLLYGNYLQYQPLYQPQPNLIAELTNHWSQAVSSNANIQYDTVYQQIDAYAIQMRYNPEDYKVLNARFSYQYNMPVLYYAYVPGQSFQCAPGIPCFENQYALDLSGQWPLFSKRWLVSARANYDFTRQQWLNFLGGLEYNGGCWAIRGVYGNYLANSTNYTSTYYIDFELKGLSGLGSDPTDYLKQAIPGYMPVTSVPGFAPITQIH